MIFCGPGDLAVTIIRREHTANFTILPNEIFFDARLSIETKGVLAYLLSRPRTWSVRQENVGRALNVGRKKLQRIFRELIGAGYLSREQRIVDGRLFGEIDYVVRDVSENSPVDKRVNKSVEKPRLPQARKGPAVRGPKRDLHIKTPPQVPNGPAYKELEYKNGVFAEGKLAPDATRRLSAKEGERPSGEDDARQDLEIVALFKSVREGWEALGSLCEEDLADLRRRRRRGELDELAIMRLKNRLRDR